MVIQRGLAMGLHIALETRDDTANEARVVSDVGKSLPLGPEKELEMALE